MTVAPERGAVRARLRVRVKPRSSVTEVVGMDGGALVVRVAAPPVDGRANRAVCELVADLLDIGRSSVRVEAGERSRDKVLVVDGLAQARVDQALAELKRG